MNSAGQSISRPINLRGFLNTQPRPGFDWIAVVDIVLIVLFLGLNTSQFIFAPGTEVELSPVLNPEQGALMPSAVLTAREDGSFYFDNQKIAGDDLEEVLKNYVGKQRGAAVLLVKADRRLVLSNAFEIMEYAKKAGFSRVLLAGEPESREEVFIDSLPE